MVFWHYLTVPEFEYSGTCKQSGSLVLPKIPKLNDPNRIQRRFLADWKRYWDSIGRHMKSMCNRVGCKGACLWRCGLRCLGLCCVPCALAIDVCCDSKDWKENCSASISRIRILIGIERTNTSLDDNDIESHTKGVKWDLDNIYNQENIHIPNEKNELLSENNSKVIDKNHTGSLSEIDSVKALLRRGLRKYELEGYGYIILSVLVNVPWIIINRNVSGQINYQ